MNQIIIAADSRGAGLQKYISSTQINNIYNISTTVIPGGKLIKLNQILQENYQTINNQIYQPVSACQVILAGGICNFTSKEHHTGGVEISYTNSETNILDLKSKISEIYQEWNSPTTKFKICHIPSVSLDKSAINYIEMGKLSHPKYNSEEKKSQQEMLDKDLKIVNDHILNLNETYNLSSVRWDHSLMKIKIKKRNRNGNGRKRFVKFNYTNLYDGVHANLFLKSKWYELIFQSLDKDTSSENLDDDDQSSSSEEEWSPSWDFKRSKST